MRASLLAVAVLGGVLAGCSKDSNNAGQAHTDFAHSSGPSHLMNPGTAIAGRGSSSIASLADRGSLVAYDRATPVHRGAATWHPAQLSEAYALRSIAEGSMTMAGPNGEPIRLQYERHVEHPDGNWTWIGRVAGADQGTEAILTFGKDAVFGTIGTPGGQPLQVTTASGRTWVVESDPHIVASQALTADSDFLASPVSLATPPAGPHASAGAMVAASAHAMLASHAGVQAATAVGKATVDVVVGYTTGFATRLGGQSQALTRLNSMIDIANQAYVNSNVAGEVRLVRAIQVDYADATANRAALLELTGVQCTNANGTGAYHLSDADVNCTPTPVPTALQPLVTAREQAHADLAVLVRTFQSPENQSCGVAWLLGGGQQAIDGNSAKFGYSVVSDSSGQAYPDPDNGATCRDETLAHELGHNMGLAHDRVSASRGDDNNGDGNNLDPSEYGRYADSFGYSTGSSAGNFYTIMSIPNLGQTGFRVFSNPQVTYCGGLPCGVAGQDDNARTLGLTMPIVASFRGLPPNNSWLRGDFDGDGRADVVWRNSTTGANTIWKSANSATSIAVTPVGNQAWAVVGAADFDGDHKADILWHNSSTGQNVIWKSGNSSTSQAVTTTALAWQVAGAGDFDGDGRADIVFRNTTTGANVIWKSANSSTSQAVTAVTDQAWIIAGVGDFDGDGKSDLLWRNTTTGSNAIWRSANSASRVGVTGVTNLNWFVVGVADFDGDGKSDILWRNTDSGQDAIWKSGNYATQQAVVSVTSQSWIVSGVGDFDGDHKADILWRNLSTGQDVIWKSGNYYTQQPVSTVTNFAWMIVA